MGTTAKGIMLSGIYCILGLYNLSFNASEETSRSTAYAFTSSRKAEQLSMTGISIAKSGDMKKKNSLLPATKIIDGIPVTYFFNYINPNLYSITSVVTINDQQVTTVAMIQQTSKLKYGQSFSRWSITNIQTDTKSALKKTKK